MKYISLNQKIGKHTIILINLPYKVALMVLGAHYQDNLIDIDNFHALVYGIFCSLDKNEINEISEYLEVLLDSE